MRVANSPEESGAIWLATGVICAGARPFRGRESILVNPGAYQFDLGRGKRVCAHRHTGLFTLAEETLYQWALRTIARDNRLAGLASLNNMGFSVEPQTALRFLPAMAREATLLEDGGNVPCKIDHSPWFGGGGGRLASNSQPTHSQRESDCCDAARQQPPPVLYTPWFRKEAHRIRTRDRTSAELISESNPTESMLAASPPSCQATSPRLLTASWTQRRAAIVRRSHG